ncbi:hypothetical protein [Corynebacterium aquilae]|uniref:hypothetical protein n=1 Tax=Corynebacterium aquilae TaxID=203263 RepID=UPI0009533CC3|nr:hypothetical protein [Corynebacterium aquilae]
MRRIAALVCATACAGFSIGLTPVADARPATPQPPGVKEVASEWVNPAVRPVVGKFSVDVDSLSLGGKPVTAMRPGQIASLTLTIRNDSDAPMSNVRVRLGRADAVGTVADGRAALAADDDQYPVIGEAMPVSQKIPAGQQTNVTVPVDVAALDMTATGVYPILVQLVADAALSSASTAGEGSSTARAADRVVQDAVVDSERFLLTIDDKAGENPAGGLLSNPGVSALEAARQGGVDGEPGSAQDPARVSILWPLTAETHIVPGATGEAPNRAPLILADDDLSNELADGGRLDVLLRSYEEAVADPRVGVAACLALDPALLDTVERMSHGYTVNDSRPSPVAERKRLRDSWGSEDESAMGRPGRGQQDAQRFIARVSAAARGGCSVALPWANSDVNALVRTGSTWLVREGISQGSETIRRITGARPIEDVVIPGSGFVDGPTAAAMTLVGASDVATEWEDTQPAVEVGDSSVAALDETRAPSTVLPDPSTASDAVVVLADNTVWGVAHSDSAAALAPGVTGALFPSSLMATLAQLGEDPATMPYSNPATRFDYRRDSVVSRRLDAVAALGLSAANHAGRDLLVVPPTTLSSKVDADAVLGAVADLIDGGRAVGQPAAQTLLDRPVPGVAPSAARLSDGGDPVVGSPFVDPMTVTDFEIQRGAQQATYTDDVARLMVNDPQIALTRYRFVEPLLKDVVRAFSLQGRLSLGSHEAAVRRTDEILNGNRDMLMTLRSSVSLLPPGNVFTRTSEASPLPMVARNGLPLPVVARLRYAAPEGVSVGVADSQLIPAKGSLTVMLPASVPEGDDRVTISIWLATPEGAAISQPVEVEVQTRSGLVKKGAFAVAVVLAALVTVAARFVILRRRRAVGAGSA